jgi:DNA-binding NtrC family response regulator
MRDLMETLIDEMLDGQILLGEAIGEFQKLYIQKALARNSDHISNTADALGVHRNTLSKRVAEYDAVRNKKRKTKKPAAKIKRATASRSR